MELGVPGARGVVAMEEVCVTGTEGTIVVRGLIGSGNSGGIIREACGNLASPCPGTKVSTLGSVPTIAGRVGTAGVGTMDVSAAPSPVADW